jgi:hypothetical protein
MSHDVSISHSSADKRAADAACALLEARGIKCSIAPRGNHLVRRAMADAVVGSLSISDDVCRYRNHHDGDACLVPGGANFAYRGARHRVLLSFPNAVTGVAVGSSYSFSPSFF